MQGAMNRRAAGSLRARTTTPGAANRRGTPVGWRGGVGLPLRPCCGPCRGAGRTRVWRLAAWRCRPARAPGRAALRGRRPMAVAGGQPRRLARPRPLAIARKAPARPARSAACPNRCPAPARCRACRRPTPARRAQTAARSGRRSTMPRAISSPAIAVVLSPCPPKPLATHTPRSISPICGMRWMARPSVPRHRCAISTLPSSGKLRRMSAASPRATQRGSASHARMRPTIAGGSPPTMR